MAAPTPTLRAAARTMLTDAATGEVLADFHARAIPSILLRGPALARRLFNADETRLYVDADVLVPPGSQRDAADALAELGFEPVAGDTELALHRPRHAREWRRSSDRVSVDLHRTVAGCRAADGDVWRELHAGSETATVGGQRAMVPGPAGVVLVVALHAAHNGPRGTKPLGDLERAFERFDPATWADAAALARRLDAVPAFSAGVRLRPRGVRLAAELGLPDALPVDVGLRATGAPPLALGLDWLTQTTGLRAKAALALHVLAPPPGALRTWRMLARRGAPGLAAAYVSHPFWLARHAVPSLVALRRARKDAA